MADRCGHCGRENTLEVKGTVQLSAEKHLQQVGNFQSEVVTEKLAQVERCSACGKPTLSTYWWMDEFLDPADVTVRQLYPVQRDVDDLPNRVGDRYAAMLELQHAPDAFAVRAGRLLETVCSEQGVERNSEHRDLADRLDA